MIESYLKQKRKKNLFYQLTVWYFWFGIFFLLVGTGMWLGNDNKYFLYVGILLCVVHWVLTLCWYYSYRSERVKWLEEYFSPKRTYGYRIKLPDDIQL